MWRGKTRAIAAVGEVRGAPAMDKGGGGRGAMRHCCALLLWLTLLSGNKSKHGDGRSVTYRQAERVQEK